MSLRPYIYLVLTGGFLAILLASSALFPILAAKRPKNLIYRDIQGMEVKSGDLWYTLNFEQQSKMAAALEEGRSAILSDFHSPTIEQVRIYHFNGPAETLVINP